MKSHFCFKALIIFLLFTSFFIYADDHSLQQIESLNKPVYLTSGWKIFYGDSRYYKDKDYDDSGWESLNIPENDFDPIKLDYTRLNYVWLRIGFKTSDRIFPESLGLYTGKIYGAAEVYLNGSLIGAYGKMPVEGYFENHNIPKGFVLPEALLDFEGTNVLAFRIYSERSSGFMEVPFISRAKYQQDYTKIMVFLNSTVGLIVSCIALFTALYYAILFIRNPKDYMHLFLALGSLLIAIDSTAVYWSFDLFSRVTTTKIQKISFYFGTLFYVFFYQGYCKAVFRKVITLFLTYYLGLLTFILLVPTTYAQLLKVNNYVYALYFSVLLSYLTILLVSSMMSKNRRRMLFFFLGLLIFGVSGLADLYHVAAGKIPVCWFYPWGVNFFLIFSFLSSADLFIETSRQKQFISDFLRNISHEMRTPLNGILGCAEIVKDSSESPTAIRYSNQIVEESERLMQMINGLLDVGRIEAGVTNLDVSAFHLGKALKAVFSSMQVLAEKKGIILSAQMPDAMPSVVIGDKLKLQQILTNIIGNSIKFTEKGYISVVTTVTEKRNGDHLVIFEVRDTGIGLTRDQVENLFEPFYQADNSMTKSYNGSGLGTTIAQQYARLMGGDISVESQIGVGSFFHISIVLEPSTSNDQVVLAEKIPQLSSDMKLGITVLAAEDYPLNQEIIANHLERMGCKVIIATNGAEALKIYQSESVDVILMDIQMPVMDGIESAQKIRSYESLQQKEPIPIIAMTANAFERDIEACFQAGMNDVLIKPFRREAFILRLNNLLSRGQSIVMPLETPEDIVFDYENLLDQWDHDHQMLANIYKGFLDQSSADLKEISQRFEHQDARTLHRKVHALKGAALNLYAYDLAKKAENFEKELKNNILDRNSLDQLTEAYNTFKEEADQKFTN